MYQPPTQPPRSQTNKTLGTGCGVLLALFLLIAACGAITGKSSDVQTTADQASESAAADARISEAISGTPTETVTYSPSPTPSPTPTGIDAAARKACTLHVQAVALRDAGWADKADDKDSAAEDAAWESSVLGFNSDLDVPQQLDDWCTTNLPKVHAKPVAKKPAARPKPKPAKTTAPSVPDGATAICNDGTVSYSRHRQGTCSHHHGVARWL